jgi:membrane protein DedA with SNARE-associated domain
MESFKPFLLHYGYWAVFGSILLEDFGLPLPGEALLIAGSVLASQGDMHIVPLLLFAWTGAVAGDNIGYGIGRFAGRRLVLRYGRYVLITNRRLDYAENFFRNHGGAVVVAARFIEILRQLNGVIAGMARMEWRHFLAYNVLGAALWVGFWGLLVYELGGRAAGFLHLFNRLEMLVIVVLAVGAAFLVGYFLHRGGKSSTHEGL